MTQITDGSSRTRMQNSAIPAKKILVHLVRAASLCGLMAATAHAGDGFTQTRTKQNDKVGSYHWTLQAPSGVKFQLIQRVPDQTRSFYVGRGFAAEAADRYATACVFQTIVENGATNEELTIDLSEWEVRAGPESHPLTLTEQWQRRWQEQGVSQSARIAFQWSQLPTVQRHAPGDWFQGMIATEVPPATPFNLAVRWREDGQPREAVFKNLECAQDRALIN